MQDEKEKPHWWKALYLALLFAGTHASWSIVWSFATTLIQGTLSFVALGLLYVSISASSFFSVLFLERFGVKWSLAISITMYAAFAGAFATKVEIIPVCIAPFLGVAQALILNTQSSYVTRCGTGKTMGRIVGFFWSVAMTGNIVGNLLTGVLTRFNVDLRIIFVGCAAWLIVPLFSVLFLPNFTGSAVLSNPKSDESDESLADGPTPRKPPKRDCGSQMKRLKQIFGLLFSRRMLLLLPTMMFYGATGPFYSGRINPTMGTQTAGIVWTINNTIKAVVLFPTGLLADLVDSRFLVIAAWLLNMACGAGVFFFDPSRPWLYYVTYSLLALADTCVWNGSLARLLSAGFSDVEGAWASYRLAWPVGTAFTLFVSPFVPIKWFSVGLSAFYTGTVICFFCLMLDSSAGEVFKPKNKAHIKLVEVASASEKDDEQAPASTEPPEEEGAGK